MERWYVWGENSLRIIIAHGRFRRNSFPERPEFKTSDSNVKNKGGRGRKGVPCGEIKEHKIIMGFREADRTVSLDFFFFFFYWIKIRCNLVFLEKSGHQY